MKKTDAQPENSPKNPPKRTKKTYTTVVVESPFPARRSVVWAALQVLVTESSTGEFAEEMSNEPPWRYVYSRPDVEAALCECSITIRDDGDTCNVAWAALIDPLPDNQSDAFVDSVRPLFEHHLETLRSLLPG